MRHLITYLLAIISFNSFSQDNPTGLNLDDKAPNFKANDQSGKSVDLKSLLTKGPVVLVFYRGQWCPYCNRYLSALQDSLSLITAKGATVVAVTPEINENISKTIEKSDASFPILHDNGLTIMKNYKVIFEVDKITIERYKGYGIDFNAANGENNGANLPVPAVYVIDKSGKIIYKHFDPDYRRRSSIAEIINIL